MKEYEIVNLVEINGVEYNMEDLPENLRREVAAKLQDTMMATIGYRRKTA